MSLKAFHVFFVCASIILTLGFAAWSTQAYLQTGAAESLVMSVVSFCGALLLGWYGVWFLRKLRGVSYL